MKNRITSSISALLLIAAGIILAGNALNWWDFNLLFKGWWTLFIIVPSLLTILNQGFKAWPVTALLVGVALLLSAQGLFKMDIVWQLLTPLVLIFLGLKVLFWKNQTKDFSASVDAARSDASTAAASNNRFVALLSGIDETLTGDFSGAMSVAIMGGSTLKAQQMRVLPGSVISTNSVMGGTELDLRDAKFEGDLRISANALMGGLEIRLPEDVIVKTSVMPLLGGVENKRHKLEDDAGVPTVYIEGLVIMGGIDII